VKMQIMQRKPSKYDETSDGCSGSSHRCHVLAYLPSITQAQDPFFDSFF
jgi:hypothetical protein